jgi:hypothetical protein
VTQQWEVECEGEFVDAVVKCLGDNVNELQVASIRRFAELTRRGGTVDIRVRVGGKDYEFEGDWLPWLFRP